MQDIISILLAMRKLIFNNYFNSRHKNCELYLYMQKHTEHSFLCIKKLHLYTTHLHINCIRFSSRNQKNINICMILFFPRLRRNL